MTELTVTAARIVLADPMFYVTANVIVLVGTLAAVRLDRWIRRDEQ